MKGAFGEMSLSVSLNHIFTQLKRRHHPGLACYPSNFASSSDFRFLGLVMQFAVVVSSSGLVHDELVTIAKGKMRMMLIACWKKVVG